MVSDAAIEKKAIPPDSFDLTQGIPRALELNKPIYDAPAAYGHFGRAGRKADGGFS